MITVQLDENEQKALLGIIDAGLKSIGLPVADVAVHFLAKIGKAKAAASAAANSNVVPMQAAE